MLYESKLTRLEESTATPGVFTLWLDRPKALNALNRELLMEMGFALDSLRGNPLVKVLVLRGAGGKAFIAGADISEMKDLSRAEAIRFSQLGHKIARKISEFPAPTIAAIDGFALGGGLEMALACDFIVASEKSSVGLPEVGLGIIPGFGGTFRLAQIVGVARAMQMIYSGAKITAQKAQQMGLILEVFPDAEFEVRLAEQIEAIGKQSISAVRKAKQLLCEFYKADNTNFRIDMETQAFGQLTGTPDQIEGMGAFMEKRKPAFGSSI